MTYRIPDHLAAQNADRIAFQSSDDGRKPRWSELSVWYLHAPKLGGKRWVTRIEGVTTVEGERTRVNELASGTLERALKLLDRGEALGLIVAETAREWAEDNRVTIENGRAGPVQFDSDRAALAWLYGQPEDSKGFPTMLARDLDAGASTARMQLAGGRPVMVPLRAVLPYVDRAAFRRAIEQEAARD